MKLIRFQIDKVSWFVLFYIILYYIILYYIEADLKVVQKIIRDSFYFLPKNLFSQNFSA